MKHSLRLCLAALLSLCLAACAFAGEKQYNLVLGTESNDKLQGTPGDDHMRGLGGNDELRGLDGDDYLSGGPGDDLLMGGKGGDVYLFERGDGHDVIQEEGGENYIQLGEGIEPDGVTPMIRHRDGGSADFLVRIDDTGETIAVQSGIARNTLNDKHGAAVRGVAFADGTLWTWEHLVAMPMLLVPPIQAGARSEVNLGADGGFVVGTEGDDFINGSPLDDVIYGGGGKDEIRGHDGNDYLWGGPGDDVLMGGKGDDVYQFSRGDGEDAIQEEGGQNHIRLADDVAPGDVSLHIRRRDGGSSDFIVRIDDTGDSIAVRSGIARNTPNDKHSAAIHSIMFGDGTVWKWEDIIAMPMRHVPPTDENARSEANLGADGGFVVGSDRDDLIVGSPANDVLHGGEGNDELRGMDGDDVLWGGPGDDALMGGKGDDVYQFSRGDGEDMIQEEGGQNHIRLADDVAPGDVSLHIRRRDGGSSDLIVRIDDTGDSIAVRSGIARNTPNDKHSAAIHSIMFGDGTVWNWADIIAMPMHHVPPADESARSEANLGADGGFVVGSDRDDLIVGSPANDAIHGGEGNDELRGMDGDDVLWGGPGDDILDGGKGNDVYLWGPGDGNDIIKESDNSGDRRNIVRFGKGVTPESLVLRIDPTGDGGHLVFELAKSGERLTVQNGISHSRKNADNAASIQAAEFADGTVWEWADILAQPMQLVHKDNPRDTTGVNFAFEGGHIVAGYGKANLRGGPGPDRLQGGAGDDNLNGGDGDDALHGGKGNDTLEGGPGHDVYYFAPGDGRDAVSDSGGDDALFFLGDITPMHLWFYKEGNDLVIRVPNTDDRVVVKEQLGNNSNRHIELIGIEESKLRVVDIPKYVDKVADLGLPKGGDLYWDAEQAGRLEAINAEHWVEMDAIGAVSP